MQLDPSITIAAIGVVIGICQWLSWKTNTPSILYLLLSGIILGPVFGVINSDKLLGDLLFPFISISVAIILFEGGLTLNIKDIRGYGDIVGKLVSIGVLVTCFVVAFFCVLIFSFTWEIALLIGAISVVTGPTVIKPLIQAVRPKKNLSKILQWESILIDPIGAMMALIVFQFIIANSTSSAINESLFILAKLIIIGASIGIISAYLYGLMIRYNIVPKYLQNVITFVIVITVFVLSEQIQHESGLFAVTIMGIWLSNMKDVRVSEILNFKESLSILLISALFILLAARLDLAVYPSIFWQITLLIICVHFIVRPLSVFLSTTHSDLDIKDKLFLSWISPRGIVAAAVSSLFALRLEELSIPQAEMITPIVFALIIGTVVFQSITTKPVAKLLKVVNPDARGVLMTGANHFSIMLGKQLKSHDIPVIISDTNANSLSEVKKHDLDSYHGDPTSERAAEYLDLSSISDVVAVSRDHESNALTCIHFTPQFGPDSVYTISSSPSSSSQPSEDEPMMNIEPKPLFKPQPSYEELDDLIDQGYTIQTKIVESSEMLKKLEAEKDKQIRLYALSPDGKVHFYSKHNNFNLDEEWVLAWLDEKS